MGKLLCRIWRWIESLHTVFWIIEILGVGGMIASLFYAIFYSAPYSVWIVFSVSLLVLGVPFLISRYTRNKRKANKYIGKYLSSAELLQRWDIKDFQLLDYINGGLIPYNQRCVPVPIKILNHQRLPNGFLNSINRLPTDEERKNLDLKPLEYYAYELFKKHFPDTTEILQHLPKYVVEDMVEKTQKYLANNSTKQELQELVGWLSDDVTMTIDLKKPEQLKQLDGLIFIAKDVKSKEKKE